MTNECLKLLLKTGTTEVNIISILNRQHVPSMSNYCYRKTWSSSVRRTIIGRNRFSRDGEWSLTWDGLLGLRWRLCVTMQSLNIMHSDTLGKRTTIDGDLAASHCIPHVGQLEDWLCTVCGLGGKQSGEDCVVTVAHMQQNEANIKTVSVNTVQESHNGSSMSLWYKPQVTILAIQIPKSSTKLSWETELLQTTALGQVVQSAAQWCVAMRHTTPEQLCPCWIELQLVFGHPFCDVVFTCGHPRKRGSEWRHASSIQLNPHHQHEWW